MDRTAHPTANDCAAERTPGTTPGDGDGAPLRRERLRAPRRQLDGEQGSATAEYAIVILAAVAFAGVLVAVMRSGAVSSILTGLVTGALTS